MQICEGEQKDRISDRHVQAGDQKSRAFWHCERNVKSQEFSSPPASTTPPPKKIKNVKINYTPFFLWRFVSVCANVYRLNVSLIQPVKSTYEDYIDVGVCRLLSCAVKTADFFLARTPSITCSTAGFRYVQHILNRLGHWRKETRSMFVNLKLLKKEKITSSPSWSLSIISSLNAVETIQEFAFLKCLQFYCVR